MGLDSYWSELSGWLMSCPGEMVLKIWGFWKNQVVEVRSLLFFSDLIKADQFGSRPTEMGRDLRHHKMYHAGRGHYGMVSIGFYDLCLSPCVAKIERNKLIFTACICIIIVVIDIIMAIQHIYIYIYIYIYTQYFNNKTKPNKIPCLSYKKSSDEPVSTHLCINVSIQAHQRISHMKLNIVSFSVLFYFIVEWLWFCSPFLCI